MAIQLSSFPATTDALTRRRLLLIWQNPSTRRFSRVGQLGFLNDKTFSFAYLPKAIDDPDFFALDEYPDINAVYQSDYLPVFFANRIMSVDRPSYHAYLDRLGLGGAALEDVPFEVLVRTGGARTTDTFHVVEHPVHAQEHFSTRFFVSGARYIEGASDRIAELKAGSILALRPDASNEKNALAQLIDVENGESVGWVPYWLCGEISELNAAGYELTAVAERINSEAPAHVQLLCRIDATKR